MSMIEYWPTPDAPTLYCGHCGAMLARTYGTDRYDTHTGQLFWRDAHYKCPNAHWWDLFRGVVHTERRLIVPTPAHEAMMAKFLANPPKGGSGVPPIQHMSNP
jgi:hypothetical protein